LVGSPTILLRHLQLLIRKVPRQSSGSNSTGLIA
jgi:hypothetical protein